MSVGAWFRRLPGEGRRDAERRLYGAGVRRVLGCSRSWDLGVWRLDFGFGGLILEMYGRRRGKEDELAHDGENCGFDARVVLLWVDVVEHRYYAVGKMGQGNDGMVVDLGFEVVESDGREVLGSGELVGTLEGEVGCFQLRDQEGKGALLVLLGVESDDARHPPLRDRSTVLAYLRMMTKKQYDIFGKYVLRTSTWETSLWALWVFNW